MASQSQAHQDSGAELDTWTEVDSGTSGSGQGCARGAKCLGLRTWVDFWTFWFIAVWFKGSSGGLELCRGGFLSGSKKGDVQTLTAFLEAVKLSASLGTACFGGFWDGMR